MNSSLFQKGIRSDTSYLWFTKKEFITFIVFDKKKKICEVSNFDFPTNGGDSVSPNDAASSIKYWIIENLKRHAATFCFLAKLKK